jgi:LacI family transcriptional regulator
MQTKRRAPRAEKAEKWLSERIRNGHFSPGDRLPSESELAALLELSRPTVKKAVVALQKRGLVECRPAVGSFVRRTNEAAVSRKLASVGLLISGVADLTDYSLWSDLGSALAASGYSLLVAHSDGVPAHDLDKILAMRNTPHVEGAVVCSTSIPASPVFAPSSEFPVVFSGLKPAGIQADFVCVDAYQSMATVVDHFRECGHSRIGMARPRLSWSKDIREGMLRKVLMHKGLSLPPEWVLSSELPDVAGGRKCAARFLALQDRPTALFVETDLAAIGLIDALQEKGVSVPGQVSVISCDNQPQGVTHTPPLTTLELPVVNLAERAAGLVLERIENPGKTFPCREICLPARLIVRASCGQCPVWLPDQ